MVKRAVSAETAEIKSDVKRQRLEVDVEAHEGAVKSAKDLENLLAFDQDSTAFLRLSGFASIYLFNTANYYRPSKI